MDLLLFITHNFNAEFLNTLSKVDEYYPNLTVTVLLDIATYLDPLVVNRFKHISIKPTGKINTSYDYSGHTMYINYFKSNRDELNRYRYIWIIENDVYFPLSFKIFIDKYNDYTHDLLVSEYGLRDKGWGWTKTLKGFTKVNNIGVLAVIARFSQRFLRNLIENIDVNYYGYLEAILPHICAEYDFSIQQFLPEMCGVLTTNPGLPLLRLIKEDILNKRRNFIEDKIYHPIKL
jgi:hypothetical protein